MIYHRILTEDLMAYSYLIGDEGKAVVVDPRQEIGIYLKLAAEENLQIVAVLETHRHEDMVSGAKALAEATGAPAYHSAYEDLGYEFGEKLIEERVIELSKTVTVRPLHTPGHTLGHLCYVVEIDGLPWMVLTGDTLFYGGVGRTDFYGERNLQEMTTLLHESIYGKLAELGDSVLVMPGHAAGSACGSTMDEIPISTLGFELRHNKALDKDLDAFLELNAHMQYKNPAFSIMEVLNVQGDGQLCVQPALQTNFQEACQPVIDLRKLEAFAGGHFPDSLFIPAGRLSTFLGWFCDPSESLTLVTDGVDPELAEKMVRLLPGIGFQAGCTILGPGALREASRSGQVFEQIALISPQTYRTETEQAEDVITVDVRLPEEFDPETDKLVNRMPLPFQELKDKLDTLPAAKTAYFVCGSGERAMVAASWVKAQTDLKVKVIHGGINALRTLRD